MSIFKGLNSIATIQNFQLDISFDSRYEISIFSDSLERYHQLDPNVFGFTKIRIVLHPVRSIEV